MNKLNPEFLSQLKAALGDKTMPTRQALEMCVDLSVKNTEPKSPLLKAIVKAQGVAGRTISCQSS